MLDMFAEPKKILELYFFYQRISRDWENSRKKMDFFIFSEYFRNYEIHEKMFYTKVLWYFVLFI